MDLFIWSSDLSSVQDVLFDSDSLTTEQYQNVRGLSISKSSKRAT